MKLIIDGVEEDVYPLQPWNGVTGNIQWSVVRNGKSVMTIELPTPIPRGHFIVTGSHQVRVPV